MAKPIITFKHKGKTYSGANIKTGFRSFITDGILEIAEENFREKTRHLIELISSEGGIVNMDIVDNQIRYSFSGFTPELVEQMKYALSQ